MRCSYYEPLLIHLVTGLQTVRLEHYITSAKDITRSGMSKMESVKLWLLNLQLWHVRGSSQGNEGMMHPGMPIRHGQSTRSWNSIGRPPAERRAARGRGIFALDALALSWLSISSSLQDCPRRFRISFFSQIPEIWLVSEVSRTSNGYVGAVDHNWQ